MYAAVVIQKAFINRLYSLKVNEGEEANALAFISATAIQKPGPSCEVNTYHYCGIVENLENGFWSSFGFSTQLIMLALRKVVW